MTLRGAYARVTLVRNDHRACARATVRGRWANDPVDVFVELDAGDDEFDGGLAGADDGDAG